MRVVFNNMLAPFVGEVIESARVADLEIPSEGEHRALSMFAAQMTPSSNFLDWSSFCDPDSAHQLRRDFANLIDHDALAQEIKDTKHDATIIELVSCMGNQPLLGLFSGTPASPAYAAIMAPSLVDLCWDEIRAAEGDPSTKTLYVECRSEYITRDEEVWLLDQDTVKDDDRVTYVRYADTCYQDICMNQPGDGRKARDMCLAIARVFYLLRAAAGGLSDISEKGWIEGEKDLMLAMREYVPLLVSLSAEIWSLADDRHCIFSGGLVVLVVSKQMMRHVTIKYEGTQVSWGNLIAHYMEQVINSTNIREEDVPELCGWVSIRKDRLDLIKLYIGLLRASEAEEAWKSYLQLAQFGYSGEYYSFVTEKEHTPETVETEHLGNLHINPSAKVKVVKGNGIVLRPTLNNEVDVKDRAGKSVGKLGVSDGKFTWKPKSGVNVLVRLYNHFEEVRVMGTGGKKKAIKLPDDVDSVLNAILGGAFDTDSAIWVLRKFYFGNVKADLEAPCYLNQVESEGGHQIISILAHRVVRELQFYQDEQGRLLWDIPGKYSPYRIKEKMRVLHAESGVKVDGKVTKVRIVGRKGLGSGGYD